MTKDGFKRMGIEDTEVMKYDRSKVESGRHDRGVDVCVEGCSCCWSSAGKEAIVVT